MTLSEKIQDMAWTQIGASFKEMVLATVNGNAAAARTVSLVAHDKKLYFATCAESDKGKQMKAHPQVALCEGGLRVLGTAKLLGHPYAAEQQNLLTILAPNMPWLEQFKNVPSTVFVEITPTLFNVIEQRQGMPVELVLDLVSGESKEITY